MEDASNPLSSLFKNFWKAAFRGTYLETKVVVKSPSFAAHWVSFPFYHM
jgi:hypothetical protein